MVSVYKITDCNGLNYIGTTTQKLSCRISGHRYAKKNDKRFNCSSSQLNLDDCHVTLLETCDDENRKNREQYWIDNFECVNIYPTIPFKERHPKEFRKKVTDYRRELRNYKRSWGDDSGYYNNNLLSIDVNLFL